MGAWIKGGLGVLSPGGDKVRQFLAAEPLVNTEEGQGKWGSCSGWWGLCALLVVVRKRSNDSAAVGRFAVKQRHGRCALWSSTAVKLLCCSVAHVDSKGGETGWGYHGYRIVAVMCSFFCFCMILWILT